MNIFSQRLTQLISFFEQNSDDPGALEQALRRAGLPKNTKAREGGITPDVVAEFVRHACDVLGDTTFGVRAGLAQGETGSLPSYIGKFSMNLRAAIENSQRYYSSIDPSHAYSLRVAGNFASFELDRIDPTFAKYHRYTEFLLFGALSRMRSITGVSFFPMEIRLDHDVKSAFKSIQRIAGFPVVFGTEKTEIILPLSALEIPIPTYNPDLRTHLMQFGERLVAERPDPNPSLQVRIEGMLAASLPGRVVSADEVASNLGMSRRTFARRLKDEGVSFREIVDDLRCDLAQTYLKGGFSISEVAFYLDYANQAAFSTAFKRWTGINPSGFQNSRQNSDANS